MANYFKNLLKYAFVSKSLKVKYVFVDVFVVLTLNVISKNMTDTLFKNMTGKRQLHAYLVDSRNFARNSSFTSNC